MNISPASSAARAMPQPGAAIARNNSSTAAPNDSASSAQSASNVSSSVSTASAAARNIDFKSATRQEVFDWMNGEILAGRMTVDESTPLLGMTLKMSAATFQPVDMATDTQRINFVEKAQLGIKWADAHGQRDQAAYLRRAVDIMQRVGALTPKFDVVA